MKRSLKSIVAGVLATILALIPLTAFAKTDYNPDVTKADGTLKTGYYPANKDDKDEDGNPAIWWKTVPDTEGWKETDKATYDLTDDDQRKTADGGFTSWRAVDFATYASVTDAELKQAGYTDWVDATRDEYYAISDDNLRDMIAGLWTSTDKATYDSLPDDQRKATVGDWWTLGDSSNWKQKMDIWNSYPAENRRATGLPLTFHEVDKDTYLAFEQLWPGQYGKDKMYYFEDNSQPSAHKDWPWDKYQIVANTYNAYNHDPGFVYVGAINMMPGYQGAEALTVQAIYGVIIAPNATVNVSGKWIGTIIADVVNSTGESTYWHYDGDGKGFSDVHYYIADPLLEVRDITYEKRDVSYKIRDNKFEIRDRVVKYYVTGTKDFYCLKYKYVPKTGDFKTYLIIGGIIVLLGAAVALIVTNRVKSRR